MYQLFELKTLRFDSSGRYVSTAISEYLDDHGTQQKLSFLYNPQQSGWKRHELNSYESYTLHYAAKIVNKELLVETVSMGMYFRICVTT